MEVDSEEPRELPKEFLNENDEITSKNDNKEMECEESSTVEESITGNCQNGKESETDDSSVGFKKPVLLVGPKRGKGGKVKVLEGGKEDTVATPETSEIQAEPATVEASSKSDSEQKQTPPNTKDIPLRYVEPSWSGISDKGYKLEVLKSGMIIETIELNKKSHYVIGRLPICNIALAHPTISRYHAILQFRVIGDEKNPPGLYLYDLGSTHGSYWNGNRIRPNVYVRVQGGHMLRFGCSQRKFILQAPEDDQEEESELTVTELKQQRTLELQEREKVEQERLLCQEEMKQKEEKEENEGIDWGMGEDADEETDLTENPFASQADEELYLDDPKKTLRGWFEREGYDLLYQVEERGIGQFLCWVDLPIEGVTGHPVRADALVKGKKKESVIQCALESCRILDRYGLLRQANHEARKRKTRNWEEEDFYDSDEDNFLDRTGTVEKKRELRMRQAGKLEAKVETYTTLTEKHENVLKRIAQLEEKIERSNNAEKSQDDANEDALDAFMSSLSSAILSKGDIRKMKMELQNLKKEETKLLELVNIAKPANLPPLLSRVFKSEKPASDDTETQATNADESVGQKRKRQAMSTEKEEVSSTEAANAAEGESEVEKECKSAENPKEDSMSVTESVDEQKAKISEKTDSNSEKNKEQHKTKDEAKSKKQSSKAKKEGKKHDKYKALDMYKDDYSMWVPPTGQSGDGKTSLNEKYGY